MRIRFAVVVLSAVLPLSFIPAAMAAPSSSIAAPASSAIRSPAGEGITLTVTLGSDVSPGACGTDTTLVATRGDQVNVCYTVTNTTGETLTYHSLSDDVNGPILTDVPATLAPGASYQYNRIIVATDSEAPTATWTAYDEHPDYAMSVTGSVDAIFADGFDGGGRSPAFIDISATGTNLMLNDDDYTVASIGFPFTFYGRTADSLTASNNGGILFDQVAGTNGRAGYVGPTPRTLPDRMMGAAILPYWEDLHQDYIDGIGNTFVETIGTAPNRKFVVEWFNLPVNFGTGLETVTLEAILSEGSNAIDFVYADTTCGSEICDDGAGATIGINEDALHAILYSFKQPDVTSGTAIHFEPTTPNVYTATAQATLDVGAPVVTVDPASFDKTVAAGASTSDTLTIGNTGDRGLAWNIGAVDSRAHFPIVPRFALPVGNPSLTRTGPAPSSPPRTKWLAPHPDGLAAVPAFAADVVNAEVVGFDANAPSSLTSDFDAGGLQFLAGDFKGEDFSTLYAIDFRSFDLYKVDTATGATTLVYLAVPPPGAEADGWNGLSWDPTTNTMFAVTSGGRTAASSLIRIDPDTAEAELVGPITGVGDPTFGTVIIDIAVDPNGLMYGVDIVTDTLVAIDKTTGDAQTIGSIGFDANFSEGLDFDDSTGKVYFSAYDNALGAAEMYTLDTETGAGTLIGPIGPHPEDTQYPALAIARLVGACAYPEDVPWLAFSTTRGSTAPGETTPIGVTFDATSLSTGEYTADICVNSNDIANKRLAVPVTLTVE
jgi:hypothetical protein